MHYLDEPSVLNLGTWGMYVSWAQCILEYDGAMTILLL